MQQVANSIEWSDRLYVDGAAESGERRRSQRGFGRRTSRSPTPGRFFRDRRSPTLVRVARGGRRRTMISKLFSREPDTRVFFATDIHGSETCWRKFLNSGKHYAADVIVLGGDMTGKALVPIVHEGSGRWHATLLENRHELQGEEAVVEFENAVKRRGYYPFRTTDEELREYEADE